MSFSGTSKPTPNDEAAPTGRALGIYTSIVSTPQPELGTATPETGEKRGASLVRRFMLQSAARELLPRERVATCLRIPRQTNVEVWRTEQAGGGTAHYGGLCVCGSVWQCPVCAAKISERRRVELSEGIKRWAEGQTEDGSAGGVLLVTFTLRHKHSDDLRGLVTTLTEAFKQFQAGAVWVGMKKRYGIVGTVRAFEATHGRNGWHPHLHVLIFLRAGVSIGKITNDIKHRWLGIVERLGGSATWEHGVDVRAAERDVADYVAKYGKEPNWTAAHEVAKAVTKRGKQGGRTPMELLHDYATAGDERAGQLWRLYSITMTGRNQMTWSRKLRDLLGLKVEKTDEELANEHEEKAVLWARLTLHQWRTIVGNDMRAELLLVVAKGDEEEFYDFLADLGIVLDMREKVGEQAAQQAGEQAGEQAAQQAGEQAAQQAGEQAAQQAGEQVDLAQLALDDEDLFALPSRRRKRE
jgi:hypothetical protein